MRILIINPNSSHKVTNDLQSIIKSNDIGYDFYTAPEKAPPEINNHETSVLSEKIVLEDLKAKHLLNYDGYLICCFSDHPLIYLLSEYTKSPIMGIMQACLVYRLLNRNIRKLIIVTSHQSWELILDQLILLFYKVDRLPSDMCATQSFNINVTNLNNPQQYATIKSKISSVTDHGVDCVFLGCAGMVGLDQKLCHDFPGIKFIDSVKIGIELLGALVRFNN